MNENWHELKGDELAKELFAAVKYIDSSQTERNTKDLRNMRLYGNYPLAGLRYDEYNRPATSMESKIQLNVIQSMCDSVSNKISKNKPRIQFITTNGTGKLRKKAKLLTQFIDGMFDQLNMYEEGQRSFLDASIFGTGACKFFRDSTNIFVERVFPNEVVVDEVQGKDGRPSELHHRRYVSRAVLKKMFPKAKKEVDALQETDINWKLARRSDQVLVIESWKLPTIKGGKDGKHVICVENKTLFEESYEESTFPFEFLRWNQLPLGFYGQGLAEQLTGIQMEINKILIIIQRSMHLMSTPKVFIDTASSVVSSHINNDIGALIKYTGKKPDYEVTQAVHPELFAHLDRLYMRAYEIGGVSQLSAQSKKPSGLNSGKALLEFNDLESERFILASQRYEKFFINAARQIIKLAKQIYDENGEFKVNVKGKKFLKQIDWSEIDLEEDQYTMQMFPTNILGNTPAGRSEKAIEMINSGLMSREQALLAIDMPDLEAYGNFDLASLKDIQLVADKIIEDGEYTPPEAFQNLKYGIPKMMSEYLTAKNDGLEEERLEMIRLWITDAQRMLKEASMQEQQMAAQAQQQQAMAGGQVPTGQQ